MRQQLIVGVYSFRRRGRLTLEFRFYIFYTNTRPKLSGPFSFKYTHCNIPFKYHKYYFYLLEYLKNQEF